MLHSIRPLPFPDGEQPTQPWSAVDECPAARERQSRSSTGERSDAQAWTQTSRPMGDHS